MVTFEFLEKNYFNFEPFYKGSEEGYYIYIYEEVWEMYAEIKVWYNNNKWKVAITNEGNNINSLEIEREKLSIELLQNMIDICEVPLTLIT